MEGIAEALRFHDEEDGCCHDTELKLQKAHAAAAQAAQALEAQAADGSHCSPAMSYLSVSLAKAVVDLSNTANALYADHCAES